MGRNIFIGFDPPKMKKKLALLDSGLYNVPEQLFFLAFIPIKA